MVVLPRKGSDIILLFQYTIPVDPRTKKNHQMIAGTGKRCPYCNKPARQFIRQGGAHQEYNIKAYPYLQPKPLSPINQPVHIRYAFYMKTRRKVDILNLQAAADDLLVLADIIQDDNSSIVKSHDGTRVYYDKENPRTEIYIYTYEEG
jgi:Holliday junction resolvase RusA-like endonuclease